MESGLLQDWLMLDGSGTTSIVQNRLAWLDLAAFGDATLWLEVRAVTNPGGGNVVLSYETSPTTDNACFAAAATVTVTASASPTITKVLLSANPATPLARYLRWKLVGTTSGAWSVSFRIHAMAKRSLGGGGFTPTSLPLTGFWRASYGGSPWVGTDSAGSSGTRNLAEATNPPSVGSAVNGLTPADFDGTNDRLTNATAFTTLGGAAGYFWWALFNVDAIDTAAVMTTAYNNDQVWADSGGFVGCGLTTSGGNHCQVWHFDGTGKGNAHPISTGANNLICARYDGTNIRSRLNSGSILSAASGNVGATAGTLQVAVNFGASAFFDGKLLELGFIASAESDARFDDIKSYINARYALSL